MVCPFDHAYAVYSAFKRAFGVCRNEHSVSFNVCSATTFTRRCDGFEADSTRDNVRMSNLNPSIYHILKQLLTKSSETIQDDSFLSSCYCLGHVCCSY